MGGKFPYQKYIKGENVPLDQKQSGEKCPFTPLP